MLSIINFSITMLGASAISSGIVLAESDDFAACISSGVPLYTISSEKYSKRELESAFYSKFCNVQRDWNKLSKENQEGVRTSWLGPYGNFAGDWSKGGAIASEEEHYRASCNVLDASYKGTFVDALRAQLEKS